MSEDLSCFYLARVTLETQTPLSIGTGGDDGVFDVALVRDANGLPGIPGSSLAGVLRHLYETEHGREATEALFGFQEGDRGAASRIHVAWGCIQDGAGNPVEGLLIGDSGKRLDDPLLRNALETADNPVLRDRVRINHRGTADGGGKFDRAVLPAGYRFSTELSMWSDRRDDPRWGEILALFKHPLLRIGGGTRAGLGKISAERMHTGRFDLATESGRRGFHTLSPGIGDTVGLNTENPKGEARRPDGFVQATIRLKPRGFWRFGQGQVSHQSDPSGKPADLLPKIEERVAWRSDGTGEMAPAALLVPASSVKGALAHRAAFHAARTRGLWAEDVLDGNGDWEKSRDCASTQGLFGTARDDGSEGEGEQGHAGRVYIEDGYVPYRQEDLKLMMHNAIDRFSGGVREHALFSEELVWGRPVEISLTIDTRGIDPPARQALKEALNDLAESRLALGAGGAKGHGFFNGSIEWSDGGQWIRGETE